MNGILREIISHFVNAEQNDWNTVLPFALFAYRSCRHTTTRFTPFFLTFGHELTLPLDLTFDILKQEFSPQEHAEHTVTSLSNAFAKVRARILEVGEVKARLWNRGKRSHQFAIGHLVLKCIFVKKGKFSKRFEGPFIISRIV